MYYVDTSDKSLLIINVYIAVIEDELYIQSYIDRSCGLWWFSNSSAEGSSKETRAL